MLLVLGEIKMRKPIIVLAGAVLCFAMIQNQAVAQLQAGAAVADITPQSWPIPMVGSFSGRAAVRAWDSLNICFTI